MTIVKQDVLALHFLVKSLKNILHEVFLSQILNKYFDWVNTLKSEFSLKFFMILTVKNNRLLVLEHIFIDFFKLNLKQF